MKVSKRNDKLKNHHNGCDPSFWNGFECCVNSLVHQNTNHTHTMVEWCVTTMVLSICNEAPATLNKGMWKHQSMNHKKKDRETMECGSSSFPKHPFSLFNHCLGSLFTHSQPPFPFFQWVIACVKKPTEVWWVVLFWEAPDDGCLGWCWWATMSHFTTTTPTMCAFLLFTPCAFHSHPHHK